MSLLAMGHFLQATKRPVTIDELVKVSGWSAPMVEASMQHWLATDQVRVIRSGCETKRCGHCAMPCVIRYQWVAHLVMMAVK